MVRRRRRTTTSAALLVSLLLGAGKGDVSHHHTTTTTPPPSPPLYDPARLGGGIDDLQLDASEFFSGSKQRPRLNILSPENGAVMEEPAVDINLEVKGYEFPSLLHDSRICLGLASHGERVMEQCFDQVCAVAAVCIYVYISVRIFCCLLASSSSSSAGSAPSVGSSPQPIASSPNLQTNHQHRPINHSPWTRRTSTRRT